MKALIIQLDEEMDEAYIEQLKTVQENPRISSRN